MRQGLAYSTISSNNNSKDTNASTRKKGKIFIFIAVVCYCSAPLCLFPLFHPLTLMRLWTFPLHLVSFIRVVRLFSISSFLTRLSRFNDTHCLTWNISAFMILDMNDASHSLIATNIAAIMSYLMALFTLQQKRQHRRRPLTGSVNAFHCVNGIFGEQECESVWRAHTDLSEPKMKPFRIIRDYIWREAFRFAHNHSRSRPVAPMEPAPCTKYAANTMGLNCEIQPSTLFCIFFFFSWVM